MKKIQFVPRGVCARAFEIELDGETVRSVRFVGGCSGNTQGIAALIKDMPAREAIKRLKGIRCGFKPTSCPDQLAIALEQALEQ